MSAVSSVGMVMKILVASCKFSITESNPVQHMYIQRRACLVDIINEAGYVCFLKWHRTRPLVAFTAEYTLM